MPEPEPSPRPDPVSPLEHAYRAVRGALEATDPRSALNPLHELGLARAWLRPTLGKERRGTHAREVVEDLDRLAEGPGYVAMTDTDEEGRGRARLLPGQTASRLPDGRWAVRQPVRVWLADVQAALARALAEVARLQRKAAGVEQVASVAAPRTWTRQKKRQVPPRPAQVLAKIIQTELSGKRFDAADLTQKDAKGKGWPSAREALGEVNRWTGVNYPPVRVKRTDGGVSLVGPERVLRQLRADLRARGLLTG